MWNEISDAYDIKINEQLAIALWGKDYEKFILQNREKDIEDFNNEYIHIQEQINDNTSMIESFEEKKEYYSKLKEQWNSIANEYEDSMNRQAAAQLLGANLEKDVLSGRLDVMNNFRNQYVSIQQAIADAAWNSAKAQIEAINAVKAAEASRPTGGGGNYGGGGKPSNNNSSASSTLYYVVDRNGYVLSPGFKTSGEASSKIGSYGGSGISTTYKKKPANGGGNKGGSMQLYGIGTKNAKSGTHIVSESGDEIIRKNDGNMVLAEGKQLFNFEGGETVFSSSESSKLLQNIGKVKPLDFNSIQNDNFAKLLSMSPMFESQTIMQNLMAQHSRSFDMNRNQQPVIVQQDINVTLPNVTNDSGYERIKKELKQMQIDAYQLAHKR